MTQPTIPLTLEAITDVINSAIAPLKDDIATLKDGIATLKDGIATLTRSFDKLSTELRILYAENGLFMCTN
jgi:prefoldin subunit 5